MNFEVFSEILVAGNSSVREEIVESLKSDVKAARDLHFCVLAGTRNYRVTIGIRYAGTLLSLPLSLSVSLFRGVSCFPKLQQERQS